MKKLFILMYLLIILLTTTWCEAASVTQANMRISAVDGTAFVDFSAAGTLTPYIGWYLKVYDSTGKTIEGYIKAAGTGETLSETEKITNGDFGSSTGWLGLVNWSIGSGVATMAAGTTASLYRTDFTPISGALYKESFDLVSQTAGDVYIIIQNPVITFPTHTVPATYTAYVIPSAQTTFIIQGENGFRGSVDNASVKQVLTPSTSGVTITNTQGGATYNWAVKTTGFNYNDSSGYTYTISTPTFTGGAFSGGSLR